MRKFVCGSSKPMTSRTWSGWRKISEHSLESKGFARHPRNVRRRNPFRSRNRGRVFKQVGTRNQKGSGTAWENAGELLRRTQHAHAHILRARCFATECGCHQHFREHFQPNEGRNVEGYRQGSWSESRGHYCSAPFVGRGTAVPRAALEIECDQCGRRRARTSNPRSARSLHHSRKERCDRGSACRHCRRYLVQPRRAARISLA